MSTLRIIFHITLFAAIAGLIALTLIPKADARDTDIYLKAPALERDDSPNVLIIVDTSGSMSTNVTSRIPYDSSINYCTSDLNTLLAPNYSVTDPNSGKPSDCATISGRIYFSFSNPRKPPSMSSDRWFSTSKNECINSESALNSSGYYGGAKIARWKDDRNWRSLKDKDNGDMTYVDCEPDGTTNGQSAGDNSFPRNSKSNAYTSTSGQAFDWENYAEDATPTLYSSNYMNYWHNSALTASQSRMQIAKDTVKSIIDANKNVRLGLMAFNRNNNNDDDDDSTKRHGGRVIMKIDTMTDARRTSMKSVVDQLTANGSTPLAETMWEARRYFGGLSVNYGDNDLSTTPLRDVTAENPAPANGGVASSGNYISPFRYGCQKAFIIYVTDGGPTEDSNANSDIRTQIGSTSCSNTIGTSPTQTSESNCLNNLTKWMHENDIYTGISENQTVTTYTVGFGSGLGQSAINLLNDTAAKGGGKYYAAENADDLTAALQSAINEALQDTTSFTAPSLSINAFNQLYNRDDIYFALFQPDIKVRWSGNVKKYRLCNTSDVTTYSCTFGAIIDQNNTAIIDINNRIKSTARSYWSASADGADVRQGGGGANITVARTLHTYRGSYSGLDSSNLATPVTIVPTTGNSVYDAAMTDPTILGLAANASSDVTPLINWMRGQDIQDEDDDSSTTDARWNYADPLHSRPVAITFGGTNTSPVIKLFSSTNDGIIRIVNNSTGAEEWAFIPKELLASQKSLMDNADGLHLYGADDTPSFWITDVNNDGIIDPDAGDRVYMYLGMRRGGRNIYAFNMTPSAKLTSDSDTLSPKLMWVIQGGSGRFARLGETWSRPKVARIRFKCSGTECSDGNPSTDDSASRIVLIFGGGYDTNQDNSIAPGADSMGNAIYIVDPLTGARLWWASNTTSSDSDRAQLELANMKYSIPSELTLTDANSDGSMDRIYVGDTSGQIWRIDLNDQIDTDTNSNSGGYVFADVGCDGGTRSNDCSATSNQKRRKFFYPPDVAQVNDPNFSTSANYDLVAIASGNREDPLDLLTTNLSPVQEAVHNRIYGFRDYDYKYGRPTTTPSALTDNATGGDLYDATANNLGTLTGTSLDAQIALFKASKGYFIDLVNATACDLPNGLSAKTWIGEKGLAKTVIFGGILYVTTYVPANACNSTITCRPNEGIANLYAVNYLDATPEIDQDKDGDIDTADRVAKVGGGIPSEPVIVIREGGTTGLVGTSGGAGTIQPPGGTNRYRTYWYDE